MLPLVSTRTGLTLSFAMIQLIIIISVNGIISGYDQPFFISACSIYEHDMIKKCLIQKKNTTHFLISLKDSKLLVTCF